MATLLAFAGSNSSTSLNYALVKHTVALIEGHDAQLLDMANFPFPMFSEDYEKENGYSNSLVELKEDIAMANGILISVNEHNGNPSAYLKNLIDWLSRVDRNFLNGKSVLLMSTSNGKGGAANALEAVKNVLPRFGANIVATFSLPSFSTNFDADTGITDTELAKAHREVLGAFLAEL